MEELSWLTAGKRATEAPLLSLLDLLNLGTRSQTLEERERSARGEGGIRAPLCHCICPERGYSLRQGLRRMTLVSHKVMGDTRLVSDDGCEGLSHQHLEANATIEGRETANEQDKSKSIVGIFKTKSCVL
ncbi:hypothetical protein EYF80_015408 [Liparis tanakae]|uniref:Uncharacterized protein n=1 Tax=Liparis tanakae TaxID=230148 RepID=A0A4Z2IA99_9TELE|nr:hypothetical protein EYF80_015408 [Liparis tanakae]